METRFVEAGGVNLQYFEHGSGPETIVFVHGFTASGRIWAKVQRALDETSFHTYAFSNRGAGDSGRGVSKDDYTIEAFARDLYEAVEALGLTNFTLVGHSLGAATAARFALDHPYHLKTLVLLNPVPLDANGWRDGWQQELEAMFKGNLRPVHSEATSAFERALQEDAMRNPPERRDGSIESMANLKLRSQLKDLAMPVLVVGGDRDEVVGVDNILAEYLALPPATRSLHIFHSVGHSPNVELAERFTGTLKRFIAGAG
ncbi:MAG: alpha/beta fold hydrolase [Dehalococcoidia bacterium]